MTTQTSNTFVSDQSNAAGASKTSNHVDVSGSFGGTVLGKITNGSTGPTEPCTVVIEESTDGGTTLFEVFKMTAGVLADEPYPFKYDYDHHCKGLKVTFDGNTAQAVQVVALGSRTTAA